MEREKLEDKVLHEAGQECLKDLIKRAGDDLNNALIRTAIVKDVCVFTVDAGTQFVDELTISITDKVSRQLMFNAPCRIYPGMSLDDVKLELTNLVPNDEQLKHAQEQRALHEEQMRRQQAGVEAPKMAEPETSPEPANETDKASE